jgi:nicotinamide-nucleotide amidase
MSRATSHLVNAVSDLLDGHSVACAESCTSGRVAAALGGAFGAEAWFRGGLVAYQVPVKRGLLRVSAPSVYCVDAAAEMANGAATLFVASAVVATTGILGHKPCDGEPPGSLFVATRVDGQVLTHRVQLPRGDPAFRADAAVDFALAAFRDALIAQAAATSRR